MGGTEGHSKWMVRVRSPNPHSSGADPTPAATLNHDRAPCATTSHSSLHPARPESSFPPRTSPGRCRPALGVTLRGLCASPPPAPPTGQSASCLTPGTDGVARTPKRPPRPTRRLGAPSASRVQGCSLLAGPVSVSRRVGSNLGEHDRPNRFSQRQSLSGGLDATTGKAEPPQMNPDGWAPPFLGKRARWQIAFDIPSS